MVDMYIKKEEMRSLNYMGQLSFNKQTKEYKQVLTRWLPNDLKPKLTLHLQ